MRFRRWVVVASGLFGLGIVLGVALHGSTASLLASEIASLQQLGAALEPFKLSTAAFIYAKNASTLLFSFIFSPFLCLMPILSLTVNGWLLSFVGLIAVQQQSLGFLAAAILPHGIFEIPALIIGEAAALSFGTAVIMALIFKEKRSALGSNLAQNLRYLAIAAILLVPAAIIETFITPLFLGR